MSQIVLLDAYSPYFTYQMMCICGIPSITLTGTVDDWRRIRERIDVIAELDLDWWCRSLGPIVDQFVRTAGGDVDLAFWRRIYNPVDAYGGEVITGWITRLYPYLKDGGEISGRNAMLDLALDEPRGLTSRGGLNYHGPGVSSSAVPNVTSHVTIRIVGPGGQEARVALCGGLVGVTQDADGALSPIAAWYLRPDRVEIAEIIDRIVRERRATPAAGDRDRALLFWGSSAELGPLFSRIASATLFDGDRAWRIRPVRDHHAVAIRGAEQLRIARVIDLPDGRSLCYASGVPQGVAWLLCRVAEPAPRAPEAGILRIQCADALDAAADIPVLGGSLVPILAAAFDTGGEPPQPGPTRLTHILEQQRAMVSSMLQPPKR